MPCTILTTSRILIISTSNGSSIIIAITNGFAFAWVISGFRIWRKGLGPVFVFACEP